MKILLTGARGNFAMALIPRLVQDGHELVLFDAEPMGGWDHVVAVQADLRDTGALTFAMQGCEAVIHAAAYHGSAEMAYDHEEYYAVNVTGTHNVLRAMLLHDVRYLVFSSSDQVYGAGMRNRKTMDEATPIVPEHISGLSKMLAEEMCRFYARCHNFRVAILRYGRFSPTDWITAGLGRLNNWLDREDVAQANELALGACLADEFACEEFLIHSAKPFTDADWPELATNPGSIIERYYRGASELLASHGLHVPKVYNRYDITKAVTQLGYDPQHNFEQFLARLRQATP